MKNFEIYNDIAERTNGDIYVGVVGPVRTGKSTFISRFMQSSILDNITNTHDKKRAIDEMPQSGAGKLVMTMQPKFVPNEAVAVKFENGTNAKVRLVDCVGYAIDGVQGFSDGEIPRMVKTPWSDQELPFAEAAEIPVECITKWNVKTLGNEERDFLFYLEKGTHTLTLECTLGDYASQIARIQAVIDDLNALYRKIIQIKL